MTKVFSCVILGVFDVEGVDEIRGDDMCDVDVSNADVVDEIEEETLCGCDVGDIVLNVVVDEIEEGVCGDVNT